MYKIRDDVDLKILEEFGFEYDNSEDNESPCYVKYLPDNKHAIFIFEDGSIHKGKFVIIYGFKEIELDTACIQDLIQADLVEGVK